MPEPQSRSQMRSGPLLQVSLACGLTNPYILHAVGQAILPATFLTHLQHSRLRPIGITLIVQYRSNKLRQCCAFNKSRDSGETCIGRSNLGLCPV